MSLGATTFTALLIFTGHAAAQTPPALTTLYTFPSPASPAGGTNPLGLVIGSGGVLYGTTQSGGAAGYGTVFRLTPPASPGGTWTETVLYSFTGGSDGEAPAGVAIGNGGALYGTTYQGGIGCTFGGGCGTVFSLTPPAGAASGTVGAWAKSILYSFTDYGGDGAGPMTGVVIGGGGVLYGTTQSGGTSGNGTVFSLTPPQGGGSGGVWTESVLYSFAASRGGASPTGLVIGAAGVLYGATTSAGTGTGPDCLGCGMVFRLTPPASSGGAWTESALYNFTDGADGGGPTGVALGSAGVLYGTTNVGGASGNGTVFSLTPPAGPGAWTERVLYNFPAGTFDVSPPNSPVVVGSGGVLYGTAGTGGPGNFGGVFSLTPPPGGPSAAGGTWTESVLYSLNGGGLRTAPEVAIGNGGVIYSTGFGNVYSLTPPKSAGGAWTASVLYNFTGSGPGIGILSGVVIGTGGVLYGTTQGGGTGCPAGCGTVFSLSPPAGGPSAPGAWTENVLYSFTGGNDGGAPVAGVVIGGDGVLYGTTQSGGTEGAGVVFSLAPPTAAGGAWTKTTLYSFNPGSPPCIYYCSGYSDGASPTTGVAIGSGGVLYGTTGSGGTMASGAVYSLSPPADPGGFWTEAVLYNFTAFIQDSPISAYPSGLTIGSGGVLYGTTALAGNAAEECMSGCGTVFSMTPPPSPGGVWTETAIANFNPEASVGYSPNSGVVIGGGGVLYGTAGSVFSLTPPSSPGGDWTASALYGFAGPPSDGQSPNGLAIVAGPGGYPVFYGTTQTGGIANAGVVYSLTPPASPGGAWTETVLHAFENGADGAVPLAALAIGSGPAGATVLYGTTQAGTVFSLQPGTVAGPPPFLNPGGIVNAGSFTAPVAPGSIASAFGEFLLSSPLSATESPLPTGLAGLYLEFGAGELAPLFYASGGQVNFQVPWELDGFSQITVTPFVNGLPGATQTINLVQFAPAIFTTNATGSGQGAILDPSYRLVDSSNPATAGAFVLIFCTGLGDATADPATGSPAPPVELLQTLIAPTVTIGGLPAHVSFSGLAPGYVGLYQVNVQVPAGLAANNAAPVVLSIGGAASNTVTIAVQ